MSEGAFEARKWGWRQTKEGIVVSFLVHPNDINADLAIAPLGTIYALGFREMPEGDQSAASSADAGPAIVRPADAEAKLPDKPRRPFSQMPRSQQCAIACQDDKFVAWFLSGTEISLCDDIDTEIKAVLDIASKRELDTNIPRGKLWDLLYARYCHETGRAAEDRS